MERGKKFEEKEKKKFRGGTGPSDQGAMKLGANGAIEKKGGGKTKLSRKKSGTHMFVWVQQGK